MRPPAGVGIYLAPFLNLDEACVGYRECADLIYMLQICRVPLMIARSYSRQLEGLLLNISSTHIKNTLRNLLYLLP